MTMARRTAGLVAAASLAGLLVSTIALLGWAESRPQLSSYGAADSTAYAASGPAVEGDRTARGGDRGAPGRAGRATQDRPGKAQNGRADKTTRGGGDESKQGRTGKRAKSATPEVRSRSAALNKSSADARRAARDRSPAPARVRLASVRLDLPVRPTGVGHDGQMALPADPTTVGWYRHGPVPGEPRGSAVIAGHLDSLRFGIGPLVRLREVQVGSTVVVTDRAGDGRRFTVKAVQRFDRQRLPAALFARGGPSVLRIITCGGGFDPAKGYDQNVVVTAVPVR